MSVSFYRYLLLFIIFYSLSCTADQHSNVSEELITKEKSHFPRPAVQDFAPRARLATGQAQDFDLKEGDLLFADEDCGPFCDAIEKVTHGVDGANFSHVGMVIKNHNNELVVLEAVSIGVLETPIDSFLLRSSDDQGNPKVLVGRIKPDYQSLVPAAAHYVKERLGKAYDTVFDLTNDQYYCSELLYYAFKDANGGTPIFQLRPMTFKDPDTKTTFPIWEDYFQKLGYSIPENQPGLNPGSMSRSLYLDIVHAFGKPAGYRK